MTLIFNGQEQYLCKANMLITYYTSADNMAGNLHLNVLEP
jgi:hypothetical protein